MQAFSSENWANAQKNSGSVKRE